MDGNKIKACNMVTNIVSILPDKSAIRARVGPYELKQIDSIWDCDLWITIWVYNKNVGSRIKIGKDSYNWTRLLIGEIQNPESKNKDNCCTDSSTIVVPSHKQKIILVT